MALGIDMGQRRNVLRLGIDGFPTKRFGGLALSFCLLRLFLGFELVLHRGLRHKAGITGERTNPDCSDGVVSFSGPQALSFAQPTEA